MGKKIKILLTAVLFTFVISCSKDDIKIKYQYYENEDLATMAKALNLPKEPFDYTLRTPKYVGGRVFGSNPSSDLITLGRVLFYDKNLSHDKSVSCASCHNQKFAFSDDKAFSLGADNRSTTRNSLALGSVLNFSVYYGDEKFGRVPFFWDNSASSAQDQAKATLNNPNEMNMHLNEIVSRVNNIDYYKSLGKYAMSSKWESSYKLTEGNILDALAAFVNAIPAYNTKFDAELEKLFKEEGNLKSVATKDFSGLSADENRGKLVYMSNCASCHGEVFGAPTKLRSNNGLYEIYTDKGIGEKTGRFEDLAKFKVPTLRNIFLTAPYMHDGSKKTMDEVLDHYTNGVKNHSNLDPILKEKKITLTIKERKELKLFLLTLHDEKLLADNRFSDPFIK